MTARIGFFLPHFGFGGIERVVLNLLDRLDRTRFEPVLLLGKRTGELLAHVPPDVPVMDAGGPRMLAAPPAIARMLREARCAVVYSGTNAANLALLASAAMMRQPPRIVVSEHTPISMFLREAKWPHARWALMHLAYRRAHAVAVPYAALGDELRAVLHLPQLPTCELLNPVIPAEALDAICRRPLDAPEGAYFVAAGRLQPVKGFDLLLESFALLRQRRNDVHLVILGEGPERSALTAQALTLGVADHVRMPGFVTETQAWFAHSLGLVVSSRREGTPNVIVEAMAAGAPVLVTNCSYGPIWLVRDGAAGLIGDPLVPEAFASMMERLVVDRAQAHKLAQIGREQSLRFTFEAATRGFESLFEAMIGDGRPA